MAGDVQLKIGVEFKEAKKELDALRVQIKQIELAWKTGAISTEEAKKQFEGVAKGLETFNADAMQTVNALNALWYANNRVSVGFKSMATEVKSLSMAGINMNRVFQDMPYGFMGIANNIEPLLMSLRNVKAEMEATGQKGSALGLVLKEVFTTPMGIAVAATGLIPLAMNVLPKFIDLLKGSSEELDKVREKTRSLMVANLMNLGMFRAAGIEQQKELTKTKEKAAAEDKFNFWERAALAAGFGTFIIPGKVKTAEDFQNIVTEQQNKLNEILMKLGETTQGEFSVIGGTKAATAKPTLTEIKGLAADDRLLQYMTPQMKARLKEWQLWNDPVLRREVVEMRMTNLELPRAEKTGVPELVRGAGEEIDKISPALHNIGNTLQQSLVQGFSRGFSEGKFMLSDFTNSILAAMATIAAQQAAAAGIAGLLSFIPGVNFLSAFSSLGGFLSPTANKKLAGGGWVNEPMVGIGMQSGRMISVAEQGPELVLSNRDSTGLVNEIRALRSDLANGKLRASGYDMVFVTDKVRQVRAEALI